MTEAQMNSETQKTPDSSLRTRLRSALLLAPAVLLILWFGGNAFGLMMAAAAGIGAFEWVRMVMTGQEKAPARLPEFAGGLTGIGVAAAGYMGSPVLGAVFLLALCFLLFAYNFSQQGPSLHLSVAGILYIGISCAIMIWVRNGSDSGLYHMLTLLFIVWASDSFAYFTGRALGGPKLASRISPKKTWSGFFGSSFGAGLVAAGMACPWLVEKLSVETLGGMGWIGYFAVGFVLAMFGQAGDLLISFFKRRYGIKDTGAIIPGHGGILDRIDALLLVALFFGGIAVIAG